MPKKHRLTGAQIRSIRSSRRVHGALFSVSVSASPSGKAQCACVVSKKVSALAVVRNLVKRRCRAALSTHLPSLPAGVFLFHAKREAAKAAYADIVRDLDEIVKRL